MQLIYGVDFTSAPSKTKPIVCAIAQLHPSNCSISTLTIEGFERFDDLEIFMDFLRRSPKWIAGVDFPLGLPRRLIENLQWGSWQAYVQRVGQMTKQEFVETLNQYRQGRAVGDREHLRETDRLRGAISPMKVYGVPVGKMFFAGAPRMLKAGFSILPCYPTQDSRIVMEVYPALVARSLIDKRTGKQSYKSDTRQKQTTAMYDLRQQMINAWRRSPDYHPIQAQYQLQLAISDRLCDECVADATGDTIDAIFASIQTAWSWQQPNLGIPESCDRLEGWICGF